MKRPTEAEVEAVARFLCVEAGNDPDFKLSSKAGYPTKREKGDKGIPVWKRLYADRARTILEVAEKARQSSVRS